jgi:hypothetical protein
MPRVRVPAAAATAALLGAAVVVAPFRPEPSSGQPAALAADLPPGATIVSAAADAYSVERPDLRFRMAAPGARGLVLVDGAHRAYERDLVARGRTVARLDPAVGFLRPDGTLDDAPAVLVRGRLSARPLGAPKLR